MAILTFGGRCEVIQHFTNDYMPIKDALQGINLHNSLYTENYGVKCPFGNLLVQFQFNILF